MNLSDDGSGYPPANDVHPEDVIVAVQQAWGKVASSKKKRNVIEWALEIAAQAVHIDRANCSRAPQCADSLHLGPTTHAAHQRLVQRGIAACPRYPDCMCDNAFNDNRCVER